MCHMVIEYCKIVDLLNVRIVRALITFIITRHINNLFNMHSKAHDVK
jgi:hypothetical protein